MKKGFVYVLRCSNRKLYTGSTRDLAKRLYAHNAGKVRTTKIVRPVQLVYMEEFESYSDARKRELYLKTGAGREWLQGIVERWPSG
jgi:predicted GIY-YIG superfamily endonuclease